MNQHKILVIDANKNIQKLLKNFLEEEGHSVVLATNGLQGIRCFQKQAFDMVVTGISGTILSNILNDLQPTIPIIACKNSSDIATIYFDESIDKPFRLNTLLSSIQFLTIPHENRTSKRYDN